MPRQKNTSVKIPLPEAAVAELPLKLRNERRLQRKLKTLFKKMADFTIILMSEYGIVPDYDSFTGDLTDLIQNDSMMTAKNFRNTIRNRIGLKSVEEQRINKEIDTYILASSQKQAELIINTTNNNAANIALNIIEKNAKNGIELSKDELTSQVVKKFSSVNRRRSATIALTETQRVSERSKMIEGDILKRSGNLKDIRKRWDAILDQKTRADHAFADGQIVAITDPFEVGGELLMHPGDRSLGASPSNLINCRCSVQYITVE